MWNLQILKLLIILAINFAMKSYAKIIVSLLWLPLLTNTDISFAFLYNSLDMEILM